MTGIDWVLHERWYEYTAQAVDQLDRESHSGLGLPEVSISE